MGARQGVRHETAGKTGVAAMVACSQKEEGWRHPADSGFRSKKQVGLRLRRGVGVGDGQRARGRHRIPRKGYSEEGRQRTGQGRGVCQEG